MRKLNRIVLINAAGFDYVEFPVGSHTQVIGVNGHGKSTLLRTILFFYLGTNEKSPYALHETKSDFVSHYLGNPPSYLIYEVSRADGEPGFHIAVTRPAGRIQFHFVDVPFRKEYCVDGNFVRPVESMLDCLREGGCTFESIGSYEEFNSRVYGVVPTQYAVFRPPPRSSGQVGILPRIISGIFTVSQLDADKLKSALTCGVRKDSLTTELDLLLLKGQLENFRRVNRAVKTYLRHEEDAVALVELGDQLQNVKADRQHAIEDLIRMAKRLPQEEHSLKGQNTDLEKERTAAIAQFNEANNQLEQAIQQSGKDIAVLNSKITDGEKIQAQYRARQIESKRKELDKLPALHDEQRLASEGYKFLTGKYGNEQQRKESLRASVQQTWAERSRCFADRKAVCERDLRQKIDRIEIQRSTALRVIETELSDAKAALEPRRKIAEIDRRNLNQDFKKLADLNEPDELAQIRKKLADCETKQREESNRQEQMRSQIELAKEKGERERERVDRHAEGERDQLESSIKKIEERRDRIAAELEKFDSSLARFFQSEAPEGWIQASKTFNREIFFRSAKDLNAKKAPVKNANSAWGVEFSTEKLPETEPFDRDSLFSNLQEAKKRLADEHDKLQAARERYIATSSDLDQKSAATRNMVEAQILSSKEVRGVLLNELVRLDNRRLTLESQSDQDKKRRRSDLDARENILRQGEEQLQQDALELQKRFDRRKTEITTDFDLTRNHIETAGKSEFSIISAEENAAQTKRDEELAGIEIAFQAALIKQGVDPTLIKTADTRVAKAAREIERISAFQTEVTEYERLKLEHIDPLSSFRSERTRLQASLELKTGDQRLLKERHQEALEKFEDRKCRLDDALDELQEDQKAVGRFREDKRFLEEWGYFDRNDLDPAPFYRPKDVRAFQKAAESAHETAAAIFKKGNEDGRKFLNRFDAETLDRKVLGFSPIHEHFDWFVFVGSELKPFVNGRRIQAMKQIQTQEFEQLIRNVCDKNSDFREGIRQVNQTALLVETHLKENNFVDVLDSIELKVERVDSNLTRTLVQLEDFENVTFGADRDLFGKRADRGQVDRAIETFEKLLREIDAYRGQRLLLTDYFEFSIRVHENGHDMGWRRSLDHIGSTGTDYLVKMLIYLSLIEIYRERAIDSKHGSTVHCILDETGVLAPKYVRSVLEYAKSRGIILITAGHSQQTLGFENWMHVRKCGQRFAAQTVLRKILKCD
jgi:hypothetical protein